MENSKILGRKAYGSIGHLPNSRLGKGDHCVPEGMASICCEKTRDRHDVVIVQEKLDGSCVAVAKVDGMLHPLGRAGWAAASSPYEQHRLFDTWVWENQERFNALLQDGERVVGEWLAQAHGTRYELSHEPFVAFDIMRDYERVPFGQFMLRVPEFFTTPTLLHQGGAIHLENVLRRLGERGCHGALDPVEGVVYRVERRGVVDFLAKWVRPDKVDGRYLPEVSGKEPVWNWRPEKAIAREQVA